MKDQPRPERRARYLSAAVATVLTVGFGYLAVRNVDLHELGDALRESNYWFLLPALGLLALAFFMRVVRWRSLFSPRTRPGLWPATQALLLGQFLNNVLPFRAGDLARIVALRPLGGPSPVETAGTVVIERVFDVLALLLLLFVTVPWLPEVTWLRAAGALAIVLACALAAAIVILRVYGDRAVRFVLRPFASLPFASPQRVEAAVDNLTRGVIALRSPHLGLVAFLWTLASWLVVGVSFWFVMLGFDLGLSPFAGLLVAIATGLSYVLPSAPAAVGIFEAAAIVALAAYKTPPAQALSYALVVHGLNVVPFVVGGLFVVSLRRGLLRGSPSREGGDPRGVTLGPDLGPATVRGGPAGSGGRTGEGENDVAESADRHLEVDDLREPR